MRFVAVLFFLAGSFSLQAAPPSSDSQSTVLASREFPRLAFPFIPRLVGIPQNFLSQTVTPGIRQHGHAIQAMVEDLYGPQTLLKRYPHWKHILESDPGFWPELVGRVGDPYYAGFFGPDTWVLANQQAGKQAGRIGEYNGSNVGGAEASLYYVREAALHPDVFGANPYAGRSPFDGWAKRLHQLAKSHYGSARSGKIVYFSEMSVRTESAWVDGHEVKMPYSLGADAVAIYRNELARLGIELVTPIDENQAKRVVVDDNILYLETVANGRRERIDVLVLFSDVESIDPTYRPQRLRNTAVNQEDYNRYAKFAGIPGIVKAWTSKRNGGFIWVGGPTTNLKRSKMFPVLVDQFMADQIGRENILLPYQDTVTFFDQTGQPDPRRAAPLTEKPAEWVLKYVLGSGGKQVSFGSEDGDELFRQRVEAAIQTPFAVIGQPFVELSKLGLTFADETRESRVFDLRSVNLMLGGHYNFEFLPTPMPTLRVARNKALRVNISGGGAVTLAVPTAGNEIQILPKLTEGDPSFAFAQSCVAEVLQAAGPQELRTAL